MNKKTVIISLSGIGNTILATPFMERLRSIVGGEIEIVLLNVGLGKMLKDSGLVDGYSIFRKNILANLILLIKLHRKKFDYSFTTFPSNRAGFNVLTFLISAKNKVSHSYKGGFFRLDFLINKKVKSDPKIHDLEQNLNLLKILGVDCAYQVYSLKWNNSKNIKTVNKFIEDNCLKDKFLIGIHPGGGGFWNKDWQGCKKRWPLEKFAELSQRLIKDKDSCILIFGGAEESSLKNRLVDYIEDRAKVFIVDSQPLESTALLIKRCKLFISNDTGLMHLSAALSVPTLGIFGPSNYVRTAPRGKNSFYILSKVDCSPCLRYPFYSSKSSIDCSKELACLKGISVDNVYNKLKIEGLIQDDKRGI